MAEQSEASKTAPVSMSDAIRQSAAGYAHGAMASYLQENFADFYLRAGIAVELAMKARLALETPVFLAPRDRFPAALALYRASEDVAKLPKGTPTIGGAEAFTRLKALDASFAQFETEVAELLKYRNGEAHLGAAGNLEHGRALLWFLRSVSAALKVDVDFWGQNRELVRVTLDENAKEIAKSVSLRITAAKQRFAARVIDFSEEMRRLFDASVEQTVLSRLDDETMVDSCPACSSPALVGGHNVIELAESWVGPEDVEVHPYVEFRSSSFRCDACGLHLRGEDEISAAGLKTARLNEGADVYQYLRLEYGDFDDVEYEPDYEED